MSENLDEYYDFSIIRKCIATMFNDVKLESFCFDYYHDQVFDNISRGMQKTEKITLLMAHCRTLRVRMEELLVLLKK